MSRTGQMFYDRQEAICQAFIDTADELAFRREAGDLGLDAEWIEPVLDEMKLEIGLSIKDIEK